MHKKDNLGFWKQKVKEEVGKFFWSALKKTVFILGGKILEHIIEWAMLKSRKIQMEYDMEEESYDFREAI
jgi:hypothetical protein